MAITLPTRRRSHRRSHGAHLARDLVHALPEPAARVLPGKRSRSRSLLGRVPGPAWALPVGIGLVILLVVVANRRARAGYQADGDGAADDGDDRRPSAHAPDPLAGDPTGVEPADVAPVRV